MAVLSVHEAEQFVNNTAQNILIDTQLRKKFRKESGKVLEDMVQSIDEEQKTDIKSQIKQQVAQQDEMAPGLNIDEAKDWLYASLRSPAWTFSLFTWLNVILFAVGIVLFVLAAVAGLVRGEEQFSIIFGVSGIASIVPLFITNPLKRVSNAASDQSQIRTVIFSYWWQLGNLRRIISGETYNMKIATQMNTEIAKITVDAVKLLEKYTEKGKESPSAGDQVDASGKKPNK